MRIEDYLLHDEHANKSFRILDDAGEWTQETLKDRTVALQEALLEKGLCPLDRVAVICENSASFVVGLLGVMAAGGIAVPVDPQIPKQVIKEMLEASSTKFVCTSGMRPEKSFAPEISGEITEDFLMLDEKAGAWQKKALGHYATEEHSPKSTEDTALLMFSSGTSGAPKGVLLSHKALLHNMDAVLDYMKPHPEDLFYIAKTMVHASTLTGEILVALKSGAGLICQNPVVPPSIVFKRIQSLKPTILCVNPTVMRLLLQAGRAHHDVSCIRLLYTSGAVADTAMLKKAEEFFTYSKVLNVYGLTEAGPRVAAQRTDRIAKLGSVGLPIQGVELCVKDTDGRLCDAGEKGVVYVKSPSFMTGYWQNPQATAEKFEDGWLVTGDIGYLDDEGELYIMGRADDMIIRGSHNIDPYRIENVIKKITDITSCVVFGVPDSMNGMRVICAFKAEEASSITQKEVLSYCAQHLASYECPQEVHQWEQIPLTSGGKISRRLAVDYYLQHSKGKKA